MILCLAHNGVFYTLSDREGFVRGRVMEEKFGDRSIWSWSYLEPDGPFLSKLITRGGVESFEDALCSVLNQYAEEAYRMGSGG